jgi:hypothetical protein
MSTQPRTIKRLPEKFTRNHYQFEQLCRIENTAIYRPAYQRTPEGI